jgi:putative NADH-flavin reductase
MKILVVGATGKTGIRLVTQLLDEGHSVTVIVRTAEKLPQNIMNHENLSITTSTILDMNHEDVIQHVENCDAIVSCLGHTMDFRGIFGHPRRLVSDSVHRLCQAVQTNKPSAPIKLLLMSSVGCRNSDAEEKISFAQLFVIGLLRLLVPPHSDNEKAANYLRTMIGQNNSHIEWAAIRPDDLIENDEVSAYSIHVSPIRSIFNAGKTSRINVAHFMVQLITDTGTWSKWKGRMPVIYNNGTGS